MCLLNLNKTFCLNKSCTALLIIPITAILLGIVVLKQQKQVQILQVANFLVDPWQLSVMACRCAILVRWLSLGLEFLFPPSQMNLCPLESIDLITLFHLQKVLKQPAIVFVSHLSYHWKYLEVIKDFWNVTGKLKWKGFWKGVSGMFGLRHWVITTVGCSSDWVHSEPT